MPPIEDENQEPNPLFTQLGDDEEEDQSVEEGTDGGEKKEEEAKPEVEKPEDKKEIESTKQEQGPTNDPLLIMRAAQAMERELRAEFPDFEDADIDSIIDRLTNAGGSTNLLAYKEAGAHIELGCTLLGKMHREGKIKPPAQAPVRRKAEPSNSGGRAAGGPKTQSAAAQKFNDIFGGVLGEDEAKKYSKLL